MESQPQNPEFRNNPETFTHVFVVFRKMQGNLKKCDVSLRNLSSFTRKHGSHGYKNNSCTAELEIAVNRLSSGPYLIYFSYFSLLF